MTDEQLDAETDQFMDILKSSGIKADRAKLREALRLRKAADISSHVSDEGVPFDQGQHEENQ